MGRGVQMNGGLAVDGRMMPDAVPIDAPSSVKKSHAHSRKGVGGSKSKTARSGEATEKGSIETQTVQSGSFGATTFSDEEIKLRLRFYHDLHEFMASVGQPIQRLPTLGFKELDLWVLYKEVTRRRGVDAVIAKKQWKEVADALNLPASCTDSGFRLRLHYTKYLEQYEKAHFKAPPEIPSMDKGHRNERNPGVAAERKRKLNKTSSNGWSDSINQSSSESLNTDVMSPVTSCESPRPQSPKKRRTAVPDVSLNLSKLEGASLQRYCKHYDLNYNRKSTKQDLVSVVTSHFANNSVPAEDEKQIVIEFLDALHNSRRLTTY
mmetsp:Transcript_15454/g.63046  ORF Transcript_15454/g.63046 Transcript_15454/m.63046 type:complete len:321 (-) Transcript_15454:127-1089(-)|eukprot:CAMPEP_0113966008 /NCGR_PEP_ID=MMETSP0011_2-20120614/8083_1 /TAXON_ID=101924 /ORGANISM="Rhodosorus marinus" /LENGTH=320 /DNA_ID=CAMNT_0000978627 /DNA_START=109 /DNA_END=1071 /DNA_ORIENTATION=+ /assembly_acc=CAM_ASM_000156